MASRVLLASPTGALVEATPREIAMDLSVDRALDGVRRVTVATTLAITTDDQVARALAESTAADVEHLEAFAVARACQDANVSFQCVLGIANTVGARGRAEWREHHERAAAAACAVAASFRSPTKAR